MSETVSPDIVEVIDGVKSFVTPEGDDIVALGGVRLSVRRNEFITLLGPSGCGKTTLLRCISGFEDLDAGTILLDGKDVGGVPAHRRPVNTVFQSYALFPHMSVGDNVGYSLDVAGVARRERDRRVAEALELVNLAGMQQRKPRHLSGGQQQRVALARAIISRPKLLLLDEPLSALDRNLREAMQFELKTLQHELGISFIFVTHDQGEALTMSDRIVVLSGGTIQQVGEPTEVYDTPSNAFVARFVGDSNLFAGEVIQRDGDLALVRTDDGHLLRARAGIFAVGERAMLMIRPEQFFVAAGPGESAAAVGGTIQRKVFTGTDHTLVVRLDGSGSLVKALLRDEQRNRVTELEVGRPLTFAYMPERAHLMRPEAAS
ncbi:ABC transporter ATP-binding protein [Arenibaculum sp.]|jgi:spermidine/putrescine transport system ATP-binding protein|uniref:ABC transporter ATP-binding protein n=1 Tax=Arenibaculum sp. TaxID=2865862 RepID=UPI002E15B077|nr:ABC transporter ATP-binding protein [Arenibaculum sp.]